jgi:hypothetical protein
MSLKVLKLAILGLMIFGRGILEIILKPLVFNSNNRCPIDQKCKCQIDKVEIDTDCGGGDLCEKTFSGSKATKDLKWAPRCLPYLKNLQICTQYLTHKPFEMDDDDDDPKYKGDPHCFCPDADQIHLFVSVRCLEGQMCLMKRGEFSLCMTGIVEGQRCEDPKGCYCFGEKPEWKEKPNVQYGGTCFLNLKYVDFTKTHTVRRDKVCEFDRCSCTREIKGEKKNELIEFGMTCSDSDLEMRKNRLKEGQVATSDADRCFPNHFDFDGKNKPIVCKRNEVCTDYAGAPRCLPQDYTATTEHMKAPEGYKVLQRNGDGVSFKVFYCLPDEELVTRGETRFCDRTVKAPLDIRYGEECFNTKKEGCRCLNSADKEMATCRMGFICRPNAQNKNYCELKHKYIECMGLDECKCTSYSQESWKKMPGKYWHEQSTICAMSTDPKKLEGEYVNADELYKKLSATDWHSLVLSRADRVKGRVKLAPKASKTSGETGKVKTRRILQGF